MKKSEAVQLYVQLDTADAQTGAEALVESLDSMSQSLATVARWDISGLAESLDVLTEKIGALAEKLGTLQMDNSALASFSEITNVFSSLLEIGQAICGKGDGGSCPADCCGESQCDSTSI